MVIFKDTHAIYEKGFIINNKAGEIIHGLITGEYDRENDVPDLPIDLGIEQSIKNKLWKEATKCETNKQFFKLRESEGFEVTNEMKEEAKIRSYKTLLVQHHLNTLANHGQFVTIDLPQKLF